MNLIEKLSAHDKNVFRKFVNYYGGNLSEDNLDYVLRYWNLNKSELFKAFGEEFILKKEICFNKTLAEIENDMYVTFKNAPEYIRKFRENYYKCIDPCLSYETRYLLFSLIDCCSLLASNITNFKCVIPKENTVTGKDLVINHGSKVIKNISKVIKAFDADYEFYLCPKCGNYHEIKSICTLCGTEMEKQSGYELFRQLHSQVLNQKKIKGNLCLSIHPLDYLTMSDNDSGWSSCMSWEEEGDYRLGTIEMMNSNCVVVAYIEGKTPYSIGTYEWNNKKWRQLLIVTPEIILGNKQYPYVNNSIEEEAMSWLREIVSNNDYYGPYLKDTYELNNGSNITINGEEYNFNFTTDYMYNDVYGDKKAYIATNTAKKVNIHFSGPAVCITCGKVIYYEDIDANMVECNECSGLMFKCDFCGRYHYEEDSYYVDGYTICSSCHDSEVSYCECCQEPHLDSDTQYIPINFVNTNNEILKQYFNGRYTITICQNCIDSGNYLDLYGEIFEDEEGNCSFNIFNITNEGLDNLGMYYHLKEYIKDLQQLKTEEKCAEYIENKRKASYFWN